MREVSRIESGLHDRLTSPRSHLAVWICRGSFRESELIEGGRKWSSTSFTRGVSSIRRATMTLAQKSPRAKSSEDKGRCLRRRRPAWPPGRVQSESMTLSASTSFPLRTRLSGRWDSRRGAPGTSPHRSRQTGRIAISEGSGTYREIPQAPRLACMGKAMPLRPARGWV